MDQVNICITGALGHIGSAFIRNLTIPNLGTVHLVNTLSKQRYASLMDLPRGTRYIFHEMDINSPQAVRGAKISLWKTALDQRRPYCDLADCVRAINFQNVNYTVRKT